MRKYQNYEVTGLAVELAAEVYRLLPQFPVDERFALCQQLRRAVVSIGANIAEGAGRTTDKDFAHFLSQSIGSLCEVEYLLMISQDLGFITVDTEAQMEKRAQQLKTKIHRLRERILESS